VSINRSAANLAVEKLISAQIALSDVNAPMDEPASGMAVRRIFGCDGQP
jgi:hypothetical protein